MLLRFWIARIGQLVHAIGNGDILVLLQHMQHGWADEPGAGDEIGFRVYSSGL